MVPRFHEHKDTAANVVRFAKAIEEEQPMLLQGVRSLSASTLAHAETGLHRVIRQWGLSLPIDLYYFNKGILFAPMCKPSKVLEYYLCRKPGVIFGGFPRGHPGLDTFIEAFWAAYQLEDSDHLVYQTHSHRLKRCFPVMLYADEGRGLRKAPIQVVGLETAWGQKSFGNCQELAESKGWTFETCWQGSDHTGRGSSLVSRLLLYVLPHRAYKKKQKQFWYDVFGAAVEDLADLFTSGIQDALGETWFPIVIGMKGDSPALNKAGHFTRSFQRIQGSRGVCHLCLAGKPGHGDWEDMSSSAPWLGTLFSERPWTRQKPSCLLPIPFSVQAPEKIFRSDCMHLVKLGIARHFIASTVVALGDWGFIPGTEDSVAALLELSHDDFVWCCKHEIKQTPNLKMFSKEGFHWGRRTCFPYGGPSYISFFFVWVSVASIKYDIPFHFPFAVLPM